MDDFQMPDEKKKGLSKGQKIYRIIMAGIAVICLIGCIVLKFV